MNTVINIDNELGKVKALSSWHPVNGEWVHIQQVFEEDYVEYYTNGEKVERPVEKPPGIESAGEK